MKSMVFKRHKAGGIVYVTGRSSPGKESAVSPRRCGSKPWKSHGFPREVIYKWRVSTSNMKSYIYIYIYICVCDICDTCIYDIYIYIFHIYISYILVYISYIYDMHHMYHMYHMYHMSHIYIMYVYIYISYIYIMYMCILYRSVCLFLFGRICFTSSEEGHLLEILSPFNEFGKFDEFGPRWRSNSMGPFQRVIPAHYE